MRRAPTSTAAAELRLPDFPHKYNFLEINGKNAGTCVDIERANPSKRNSCIQMHFFTCLYFERSADRNLPLEFKDTILAIPSNGATTQQHDGGEGPNISRIDLSVPTSYFCAFILLK